MKRTAVIGAGAAGCFCAAELRRLRPDIRIDVYEAGPKALAKVAVTGGGRCNLTNSFEGIRSLAEAYPRGERLMKRLLKQFSQEDTWRWFESAGVPLVLQEDHCVFPQSQDAMDIVHALLRRMDGANLLLRTPVHAITTASTGHLLVDGEAYDTVVVTTGGAPKGLPMLEGLDLEWVPTVPSLFTFTIRDERLRSLMGLVVDASVTIPGTPFKAEGPLLITDWGLSGPAVLKLSSYAARHLHEAGYQAPLSVNWLARNEAQAREILQETAAGNPRKQLSNTPVEGLQSRLWNYLTAKAGLREDIRWAELGSKGLNRLVSTLTQDTYTIAGKTRFREEFVTCGGVALGNLDPSTLESKRHPGLYFAGEVLDIDAITGGFNLQAAKMKEILLVVGPAALALLIIAILVTWLIVKTRSLNALRESEARAHERSLELLKAANEAALRQQISAIRAEMTAETERLLQQREEALSRKAQETFQTISGSLDKEMKGMKEAFEAQKKSTNESSASLKEQLEGAVRNLAAQTRDIGQKADNLASALKGQNKMAGCWGETILYNMLVDEGMVEGRDFDKEETLRDAMGLVILNEDSGKKMRPDFILHYPDRTEVIIDSKVSLDAYSDWAAADSETLKNDAAVRNLTAIRTQVKSLATKRYQDYIREGYKTLDYVIMFIPNYGALQLAKTLAPDIFREAYNQGVLLTTEETLMPFLRMIRIAWTNYDQARNQEKIVKAAQAMIDRVADFAAAHAAMGKKLEEATKEYEACSAKIRESGQSILVSAHQLVKLGIPKNPKKPLPEIEE